MNIEQIYIYLGIVIAGYLIGSIPFGYIIGKLNGIDIRTVGSGNIGATNVTRAVGPWAGKLCFALDFLKGLLPILALKMLVSANLIAAPAGGLGEIAVILAVVMGHMFTVFLKFKGGKGIATAIGAIAAITPYAAVAAFIIWLAVFKISGYVSLGSIIAAAALPFAAWGLSCIGRPALSGSVLTFLFIIAAAAIWKHRSNIQRLLNGTESSFKDKK